MATFTIENHLIGGNSIFIIAEIGQNHQGDIDLAKKLIKEAKENGADCVKFQKSFVNEKFTSKALERPYIGASSWGSTYGEHKQHLEFTIDQYKELQSYANQLKIIFTASAMDILSLRELYAINVPVIKIGSGDANNIPLLVEAARNPTPLIISTGMQDESMVHRIVAIMTESNKTNYCLLHCVSAYPTPAEHTNLRLLQVYHKCFPNVCLGYSGHEQGISISCAAVLLGAKVIERHFTLDKNQKGTDHKLSLEPIQLCQLSSMIRTIEKYSLPIALNADSVVSILEKLNPKNDLNEVKLALRPVKRKTVLNCELPCRLKLGKSLVYRNDLVAGSITTADSICCKVSEPFGISAERYDDFIGRKLCQTVLADEILSEVHFVNKTLRVREANKLLKQNTQ